MKPVSAFRTRIAGRVPGCLNEVIDAAVVDTCIDFCEKTLCVRGMLDPFQTQSGVREYDLTAANQQSVVKVHRAWCNATELGHSTDDLSNVYSFVPSVPGATTPSGRPRFMTPVDNSVIALSPVPDAAYTINIRASLRPTRSATYVDSSLYEDWVDAIVNGALSRLYVQPGDWANPKLAAVSDAIYRIEINRAIIDAQRGALRGPLRVKPVRI